MSATAWGNERKSGGVGRKLCDYWHKKYFLNGIRIKATISETIDFCSKGKQLVQTARICIDGMKA